jgi:hypothetical protein
MAMLKTLLFAAGLLAVSATPSHAFFDGMVAGLTSVTNNLIDSGENVTITSINTTSTTVLLLSNDIGKMADRINAMADKIGLMADRIGVMADRIVLTESMMARFAHRLVDTGQTAATLPSAGARGAEPPRPSPAIAHSGNAPASIPPVRQVAADSRCAGGWPSPAAAC